MISFLIVFRCDREREMRADTYGADCCLVDALEAVLRDAPDASFGGVEFLTMEHNVRVALRLLEAALDQVEYGVETAADARGHLLGAAAGRVESARALDAAPSGCRGRLSVALNQGCSRSLMICSR